MVYWHLNLLNMHESHSPQLLLQK